ncbi:hypothetical protein FBZ90_102228 [Nitrospirillum pindoramense]|uniref:Uncharacterized protein n=1 Tax=Nitrospirillum amazonense TaxID=28077 RepID=A0A560HFR7_9PROT|nr:hypothetical protein FBZ90_102228 [Nitrospirillum amazonense]
MRRLFGSDAKRAPAHRGAPGGRVANPASDIDYLPLGLTAEQIAALEQAFLEEQAATRATGRKAGLFWGRRGR